MALGKNLKKQELIPSEPQVSEGDAVGNVSTNESVPTTGQSPTLQDNFELQSRYISETEFQRRIELKQKFDQELKELSGKKVHLIVFQMGGESYAFDLSQAREVVPTPMISKLPHTPDYILGVSEIRGTVVVVFDLSHKFDIREENRGQYTMVMENEQFKVGILSHSVPTTMIVSGEEIESASNVLTGTTQNETYIKGMVKKDGKMIFYLDIKELIENDKRSIMPQMVAEQA